MKIVAAAVFVSLVLAPCYYAHGQVDSLSFASIGASDSAGILPPRAAEEIRHNDTLALRAAPSAALSLSLRYAKPGIADMITDLPGAWADWGRLTFKMENVPMYTGIGILTAAMVVTDRQTYRPLRKFYNENKTYHDAAEVFQFMGDGWFQFGIGAAFCAHGLIFNDAKSLSTASQTAEVILACGGVVQTLKHLTGRESPFVATSSTGIWVLFPNQIEYAHHVPHYDAYPSGHVATAMATLTVLTENYPDATWLKYVGYPTIGLIGVSMMGTGIHWLSDYPLSWALGYTFGKAVAHRHKPHSDDMTEKNKYAPDADFTVMSNGAPGIALTWKW
jgi:membrane-associated phospholipid phosphatase